MKTIYTASYLTKNVWIRFLGKNMKQEFDSIEEIEQAIAEDTTKNVEAYKIYKHEIELIGTLNKVC